MRRVRGGRLSDRTMRDDIESLRGSRPRGLRSDFLMACAELDRGSLQRAAAICESLGTTTDPAVTMLHALIKRRSILEGTDRPYRARLDVSESWVDSFVHAWTAAKRPVFARSRFVPAHPNVRDLGRAAASHGYTPARGRGWLERPCDRDQRGSSGLRAGARSGSGRARASGVH